MQDSCDIISSRVFPVPAAALFAAFEDPLRLAQWWGPEGFTNEFHGFDFRRGGAWRFTMRGADGAEYQNTKTFTRIIPEEEISFEHHGPVHHFLMSLLYGEEPGGGTRMTWRMTFDTPEEAEQLRGFIAQANEQNFDRLEALLRALPA